MNILEENPKKRNQNNKKILFLSLIIFLIFFNHKAIALNESVSVMKGPYNTFYGPLTGDGKIIAILDDGIDCNQGDFGPTNNQNPDNNCNPQKVIDWCDAVRYGDCSLHDGDIYDMSGHGTHVASIAAGDGSSSNGKYKGVAPNAKLIIVKAIHTDEFIKGINWLTSHNPKPDVISLSWSLPIDPLPERCNGSTSEQSYKNLYNAIINAINNGIVVVAATGNDGPSPNTVDFPACIPGVIAVGASTKDDKIWEKSGRGSPLAEYYGFIIVKPDVVAPGVGICAARANNTGGSSELTCGNNHYIRYSGTSMATPHVAGLVALIKEAYPSYTIGDVTYALKRADFLQGYGPYDQGNGRVNVINAVNAFGTCLGSCTDNFLCDPDSSQCVRCDYRRAETIIPDPSFEDNAGWNYYEPTCVFRVNNNAYSGQWSLHVERNQSCSFYYPEAGTISLRIDVSHQYTLSGKYKFVSGPNSNDVAYVYVRWLDSGRNWIQFSDSVINLNKVDENWHEFSQTFTPPARSYYANVRLGIANNGYVFYLDDIYLKDGFEKCESDGHASDHCTAAPVCDELSPLSETIIDATSSAQCVLGNSYTRDKCSTTCTGIDTLICDYQCGSDSRCDGFSILSRGNCPSGQSCNYSCQCSQTSGGGGSGCGFRSCLRT